MKAAPDVQAAMRAAVQAAVGRMAGSQRSLPTSSCPPQVPATRRSLIRMMQAL